MLFTGCPSSRSWRGIPSAYRKHPEPSANRGGLSWRVACPGPHQFRILPAAFGQASLVGGWLGRARNVNRECVAASRAISWEDSSLLDVACGASLAGGQLAASKSSALAMRSEAVCLTRSNSTTRTSSSSAPRLERNGPYPHDAPSFATTTVPAGAPNSVRA